MADLVLSDKYKAFLRHDAPVEYLEGTTAAGKTTVGMFKFMLRVAESSNQKHIISGLDLGTVEKNIIRKELGIQDIFGYLVEYNPGGGGGDSLPHILFHAVGGDKIIYILGYDNKARWKKALGGQYGCIYIDEINIADMGYVREAAMRCDYLMATLNPDDPGLPIYSEYINHSRPLPEWEAETPKEILEQLTEEHKPGWVHWFFSFEHNAGLSQEKREKIISNTPKGTKQYKNKILGLRGRSTGLIFSLEPRHIITADQAQNYVYVQFSVGVDTAYSQSSPDTFSFVFSGITSCGKKIALAAESHNNKDRAVPLTPSDIPRMVTAFADRNREIWGFSRAIYIDSADQATILECQKYARQNGSIYNFQPAWKKTKNIDRINMQCGWMAHGDYLIVAGACKPLEHELGLYSWSEDKDNVPEDRNDHCINADQYSWLPYKDRIGGKS